MAKAVVHAEARADAAVKLAQRVTDLALANHDSRSHGKAWFVLSKSVAHALDYDMRIVPPYLLANACSRVASATLKAFDTIRKAGTTSTWNQHFQAQLPVHFAGPVSYTHLTLPTIYSV